ncbi:MAG: GntR family transcriptional regulator, partial [Phycisphaerales bacterium]|nr:GntR family transcriptional regulator [Phycisphaerales bacterium]
MHSSTRQPPGRCRWKVGGILEVPLVFVSLYDTMVVMMLVVSLESKEPVVDQIVGGIRRAIASGELRPGDELPPVRQLAADLGVNLNTV